MSASEPPKWADLFGIDPDYPPTESMIYERIERLVENGWREIPLEDIPEGEIPAFCAGRNWMIDRIREALAGEDVSRYYPLKEDELGPPPGQEEDT